MAKARMGQRVAAVALAGIFLVTSLGFSGLVIWEMRKESQQKKADGTTANSQNKENTVNDGTKLKGTQLANFTPVDSITELQKIDTQVGEGNEVKAGDTVTAHYTGAVAATGVIFESSLDGGSPAQFPLSNVIQGWQDGVPGMKVGGKRRLLIPSAQAYGATPQSGSGIPANADLVFDIELVKIGQ